VTLNYNKPKPINQK